MTDILEGYIFASIADEVKKKYSRYILYIYMYIYIYMNR